MRINKILASLVGDGLARAQTAGFLPRAGDAEISIEKPQHPDHGDYSSSLPLRLARAMRMAPMEIAAAITQAMPESDLVGPPAVAAPGFINFTLSGTWLRSQIARIREQGRSYGAGNEGHGKRVQVEFVSVNPTGPLHIGHARGAVIGSALARVLEANGYRVQREYYVNDAGNQMRLFRESLFARYIQAAGEDADLPEGGYAGEYLKELAAEILQTEGMRFTGSPVEQATAELGAIGLQHVLSSIRADLDLLGVTYDNWFSEQSLLDSGDFDHVMSLLNQSKLVIDRDGARWFASSRLGQDRDNVLFRSGGGGQTYLATDIAYHYDKFIQRDFDRVIDVWGADHHGHVPPLKSAMEALGIDPDRLIIVLNQIVSFKDGEEVKRLSKRRGSIVTVRQLIDDVGKDACRFIFMSRSPEAQIEFDLNLVRKQTSENPVYYVQYAYARLSSILRTAQDRRMVFADGNPALLAHPLEIELIRQLVLLPEILFIAADRLEPHHLPHYALELARKLQRFYEECRVISSDPKDVELSKARLLLVDASRTVLARVLGLMDMSKPESM